MHVKKTKSILSVIFPAIFAIAIIATGLFVYLKFFNYQRSCSGYNDCLSLAGKRFDSGDYAAAAKFYEQACTAAPEKLVGECKRKAAIAYLKKGDSFYNGFHYEWALVDYKKAAELDPGNEKCYVYMGDANENRMRYDAAIADYSKAIEIKPNDAGEYYDRGLAYEDKGDKTRAIDDYKKAVELDPNGETGKKAENSLKSIGNRNLKK
jgi:tetratricopeptide (TPR) repeat protein